MVIFSRNGTFRSKLNQAFDTTPTGIAECFSALNIFLSITASLGNVLILIALRKISSIYPPTKLFFRCLAVTDLVVGLTVQPLYTISIISHNFCNKDERKCSTLHLRSLWSVQRQFVCNICLDVDSNNCGQTFRSVTRTEIQTCRNINPSSCSYNLYLVNWYFSWNNPLVECWYLSTRSHCYRHTFSGSFVF